MNVIYCRILQSVIDMHVVKLGAQQDLLDAIEMYCDSLFSHTFFLQLQLLPLYSLPLELIQIRGTCCTNFLTIAIYITTLQVTAQISIPWLLHVCITVLITLFVFSPKPIMPA